MSATCPWTCNSGYRLDGQTCATRVGSTTLACGTGKVAVGAFGRSGWWFDQLGLRCRAFVAGAFTSDATVTNTGALGTSGGGDPFSFTCPTGQVLYSLVGGNNCNNGGCDANITHALTFKCRTPDGETTSQSSTYGNGLGTTVSPFNYSCPNGTQMFGLSTDTSSSFYKQTWGIYCR